MVRLSGDAAYEFAADRAQIAWTIDDGLRLDGKPYPGLTCLYSPRGESDAVTGDAGIAGIAILILDMPRLD